MALKRHSLTQCEQPKSNKSNKGSVVVLLLHNWQLQEARGLFDAVIHKSNNSDHFQQTDISGKKKDELHT